MMDMQPVAEIELSTISASCSSSPTESSKLASSATIPEEWNIFTGLSDSEADELFAIINNRPEPIIREGFA